MTTIIKIGSKVTAETLTSKGFEPLPLQEGLDGGWTRFMYDPEISLMVEIVVEDGKVVDTRTI